MRYPVADPESGGLSTAAKAGIGAGAGVAAILIIGLAICLWRYRRKNKKLAQAQQEVPPGQIPPPQQQQQQQHFQQPPPMMQQVAMPNGQYPPTVYPLSMGQTSPTALAPQNTGTSGGGVSELSSQSGQGLLHNNQPGGYFSGAAVANPRASYGSSSGAGTPGAGSNGQGYPAPIAEADEGQHPYPHYAYTQHYQQQQQQQQMAPPGQYYLPQGGHAYPQHQQQHAYYQPQPQSLPNANMVEMSANREVDPPQEVMGSQIPPDFKGQ